MALSIAQAAACAVCGDRVGARRVACCGRCQELVCRACARRRGRSHETVLCDRCHGRDRPQGVRAMAAYRVWKRFLAG